MEPFSQHEVQSLNTMQSVGVAMFLWNMPIEKTNPKLTLLLESTPLAA
jgi:hypothetical protein